MLELSRAVPHGGQTHMDPHPCQTISGCAGAQPGPLYVLGCACATLEQNPHRCQAVPDMSEPSEGHTRAGLSQTMTQSTHLRQDIPH